MGTAGVGGFVYRGGVLSGLYGKLVFGDFSTVLERPSGRLFVATPPASWAAPWPAERLVQFDRRRHSLGQDAGGEPGLLTTAQGIPAGNAGQVWKPVPAGAP